jgi:hypothetical protein
MRREERRANQKEKLESCPTFQHKINEVGNIGPLYSLQCLQVEMDGKQVFIE